MNKHILLSSKGLAFINHQKDDFSFVILDQKIRCTQSVADFISPVVSRLHSTDPTIDIYEIPFNKDEISENLISLFIGLINGETIVINDISAFSFLLKMAKNLGNKELLNILYMTGLDEKDDNEEDNKKDDKSIKSINVIEKLIYKTELGINSEDEIEFIASNFDEMDLESLINLDSSVLRLIFFHPNLKLKNEDVLYDFVKRHKDSSFLLECVRFENLSQEKMIEFLSNFSLEDINYSIWERIRDRLLQLASININKRNFFPINEIEPFDGILNSLNKECKGNAHLKGLIEVTASSTSFSSSYFKNDNDNFIFNNQINNNVSNNNINNSSLSNAVEQNGGKSFQVIEKDCKYRWRSENQIGSWWEIDFKKRKVAVCGYSIRTKNFQKGSAHLKCWKLEGSNDYNTWITIDVRKNTTELNGPNFHHTWSCQMSQPFQFIRITSIGYDHNNTNYLSFSGIEFFGIIN